MYILEKNSHEIYTPKNTLHLNLVTNLFYLFRFDLSIFFKTILSLISFRRTNEIEENLYINRIIKDYSVKYIFSGQASPVKKKWLKLNPKKLIFYPQAITLRGFKFRYNRDFNYKKYDIERKKKYSIYKIYPDKSIFLTNDESEKKYFKNYLPKKFIFQQIGYLRLKKNWINEKKVLFNKFVKKKNKYIFVILGKENYIGRKEIKNKFKNILDIARKNRMNVIYKYHPRSIFDLSSIIKNYTDILIDESKNSVLYDAFRSEIVIVTSKTGSSMDCIKISKPVLDYYNVGNRIKSNIQNEFKINNKITTLYRYYKLVYPINNLFELEINIKKILIDKKFRRQIINNQKKNLNRYLLLNEK